MKVTAIIVAAGRSQRFGAGLKQFLEIDGRTVLDRSVSAFLAHPSIDEVVVALPEDLVAKPPAYLRHPTKPVRVVAGGSRRQDSVANAFGAVTAASELVVVHDAVRPFATADLISRTIAAAAESGAGLAAVRARDTVKRTKGLRVVETVPREEIFLAQTPQAFRRDVLGRALALDTRATDATDEASLVERAGHPVHIVEGELSNIKITTP